MAQYTVKSGDSLSAIAAKFGVNYKDITGYRSGNPSLIYPGEVLNIPGGTSGEGTPGIALQFARARMDGLQPGQDFRYEIPGVTNNSSQQPGGQKSVISSPTPTGI